MDDDFDKYELEEYEHNDEYFDEEIEAGDEAVGHFQSIQL